MNTERRAARRKVVYEKEYSRLEAEIMIKFFKDPSLKMKDLATTYGFCESKIRRLTNELVEMSNKDREAFLKKHQPK